MPDAPATAPTMLREQDIVSGDLVWRCACGWETRVTKRDRIAVSSAMAGAIVATAARDASDHLEGHRTARPACETCGAPRDPDTGWCPFTDADCDERAGLREDFTPPEMPPIPFE